MNRTPLAPAIALCGLVLMFSPPVAKAECTGGNTGACTRNGCAGVRECFNGRWLGCEVPDQCLVPPPKDRVVVQTVVPGQEVGILYDGADAQGSFNDRGVIIAAAGGTVASKLLPNILAPSQGNSLIAFSRSRQPERVPAAWTPQANTVGVQLRNNIRFNVTFWILSGVFSTAQTDAAAAVVAINNAYRLERAGVRIAWVTINDATADPDAAALMNGGDAGQFQSGIGFSPGEINVYVIATINNGAFGGTNLAGTPVILLRQDQLTFPQLLEHEIGHAFVLWHVGGSDFNWQNVMWPTISAHFLAEGQIFRMHFHPNSQLNLLNLRPGQATLLCEEPGIPATADCVANGRRLWADGDLPAN